jgi:hypothetical protein
MSAISTATDKTDRLATAAVAHGVRRGDRVAIAFTPPAAGDYPVFARVRFELTPGRCGLVATRQTGVMTTQIGRILSY